MKLNIPTTLTWIRIALIPAFVGVSICAAMSLAVFFSPDWLWQSLQRIGS